MLGEYHNKRHIPLLNEQGLSLVETMVSIIVTSIFVFAALSAQVSSINDNRNSMHRIAAVQLVKDYIDRMRLNRGAAKSGLYVYNGAEPSAPSCNVYSGGCDPEQLVGYDISQWYGSIQDNVALGLIPDAQANVTFDGTYYTVELTWTNSFTHKSYLTESVEVSVSEVFYPGT